MILSITNPKQLLQGSVPTFVSSAAFTDSNFSLNCVPAIRCFNDGNRFPLLIAANMYSKGKILSASNNDGQWEEPAYETDDSEYEDYADTDDESDDMRKSQLDFESYWEAKRNAKASSNSMEELSARKYEEDLVKEVEQLLTREEREILEQNEVPNIKMLSTGKWKPLQTLALAGHIKFMDAILENGYSIDSVDMDGMTALHHAVVGKREAVISHLLRRGANAEAKDKDGVTPLHYAVQVGALQTVKLLIKYKANVNDQDIEGWTPLHVAMQTRNRDIAKILLVNGADETRRNKDGNTPIDLSICYGKDFKSYELAKLLKQVSASRRR